MPAWDFLGEGSYNNVYKSQDGTSVFKVQKKLGDWTDASDTPERSVRIWNDINPGYKASIMKDMFRGDGWQCPFIEGRQSTDSEISIALIDIFNRTGRVIVDAPAPKNFITTSGGKVVCVDIGMALRLEIRREESEKPRGRANSDVSDLFWELDHSYGPLIIDEESRPVSGKWLESYKDKSPETISTIKALLFIKLNRPDIINVDFLSSNASLRNDLSKAYDSQKNQIEALERLDRMTSTKPAVITNRSLKPSRFANASSESLEDRQHVTSSLQKVQEKQPINLGSIKLACITELERYIKSRGTFDTSNKTFTPGFITTLFRDKSLTQRKVIAVNDIIDRLNKAQSIDDMEIILKSPLNFESKYTSGLKTSIASCENIIATSKSNPDLNQSAGYQVR